MHARRPKVWIVSELYYPEDTSTGGVLTDLAEGLSDDFAVNVICGQPTYARRGTKAPIRELRNGVNIYRCRSTTLDKDSILPRMWNMLTLSVSIVITCSRYFRVGDRVLVVTNPPLLPFVVATAARLRGAPFAVLVHDVYPEVLQAVGAVKEGGQVFRTLSALYRRLYRRANCIVVLGRDMYGHFAAKYPEVRDRLLIVTNWAQTDAVQPIPKGANDLLADLELREEFVVQYAGNLGRTHGVEQLVEAASLLESHGVNFLVAGEGAKRSWLAWVVQERGLSNLILLPRVPREEPDRLNQLLAAGDVGVIALVPGMSGISVPSRMYNLLSAGMPIIAVADEDSELALVVREENVGWVVPPGDDAAFAAAICAARRDAEGLKAMSGRARAAALASYRFEKVSRGFIDVFENRLAR